MNVKFDKRDWLCIAILVLLPFLWYAAPIFTDAAYFDGDLMDQYNPWWTFASDSIRDGHLPMWNPYVYGGMPYHTNPEVSLFYPFRLLVIFMSFFRAAALVRVMDTIVASLGMFLLLRHFGLRKVSGFLGALMFSYGSFMSYEFVHIPYVNTACWLPLELLCVSMLVEKPGLRRAVFLAMTAALSFLGGSPGVFMIGSLTIVVFALFFVLDLLFRHEWKRFAGSVFWGLASVAIAICLVMALLLPAYNFIAASPRGAGLKHVSDIVNFSLIGEVYLATLFPGYHLPLGAPYPPIYHIYFVFAPYVGMLGVVLAAVGLFAGRKARIMAPALFCALFGALMSAGSHMGLFPWLLERFEPFRWFRWPHDYLLMTYFVLAVAAPIGFDRIWREPAKFRKIAPALVIGYFGLAAILWPHPAVLAVTVAGIAGAIVFRFATGEKVGAALRAVPDRARRARSTLAVLVPLLLALDLCWYSSSYRLYMPQQALGLDHFEKTAEQVKWMSGHERVAAAAFSPTYFNGQEKVIYDYLPLTDEPFEKQIELTSTEHWLRRVDASSLAAKLWNRKNTFLYSNLEDTSWDYPVNASMIFRYQDVSGYDPFMIQRVDDVFRAVPLGQLWNLFNVRYVITPNRIIRDQLQPVKPAPGYHVYENLQAAPRAVVPSSIEVGMKPEDILLMLSEPGFDPGNQAMLEEDLSGEFDGQASRPAGEPNPSIVRYEPNEVEIDTALLEPGLLLLYDIYHPGWKAYIDGGETEIMRANYIFRAVPVPAGKHTVIFKYEPRDLYFGMTVSGIAWIACLLIACAGIYKKREE